MSLSNPAARRRSLICLRLDRIQAMASRRGIALVFEEPLIERLLAEADRPEFGPVELRRLICLIVEAPLARARIAGRIAAGDRVICNYDDRSGRLAVRKAAGSGQPENVALDTPFIPELRGASCRDGGGAGSAAAAVPFPR